MTNTFLENVGLGLFKMRSKAKNESIRKNKDILKCIYDEMTKRGFFRIDSVPSRARMRTSIVTIEILKFRH